MNSSASTPQEYIDSLPQEKRAVMDKLRKAIVDNLPQGFTEEMDNGMIAYVVPHNVYPKGYHSSPHKPLPFMNLSAQKNHYALYHMGLYAREDLLSWFMNEYQKRTKRKADVGKSCIRFKNEHNIPYDLVGELAVKMTVQEWITLYENRVTK